MLSLLSKREKFGLSLFFEKCKVNFRFHSFLRSKSEMNMTQDREVKFLENFHFSIWISKHFDFTFHFLKKSKSFFFSLCTSPKRVKTLFITLHFSKKSESIFFSLCTSRKRMKAFYFHFSLLELQKPTLAGPCARVTML